MAGVKGRSGGARAGSGPKKRTEIEQQESNRAVIMALIDNDDLTDIAKTAIIHAKQGDKDARNWVSSYVLGKLSENVNVKHSGDVRHSLRAIPDDVLKALVAEAQSDEAE